MTNDFWLCMKIFFDDRCLLLLKPDVAFAGQIVVPGSTEELKRVIRDFEKNEGLQMLALSAPDYKQLKRDVKSLFTIIEAAGGVVRNEVGEILFIHRRGRWDLPKGKINCQLRTGAKRSSAEPIRNEELGIKKSEKRTANNEWRKSEAVREVKEETGIRKVKVIRKLKPTYHVYKEKRKPMLKKSYWFEMIAPKDQKLVPQIEEDIRYVRWFSPGELDTVLENTFGSLREMIGGMRKGELRIKN